MLCMAFHTARIMPATAAACPQYGEMKLYMGCVGVGAWVGGGRHGVISEWDKFISWLEDLTRVSTGKGRDADEEGGSEFNIGMGKV